MRRAAAVALSLSVLACGSEPAYLGSSPELLWWTDHESGDLSEWSKTWTARNGLVGVVTSPVRSGTRALRAVSDGSADDISAAIAIHEGSMLSDTCYSAWYYLPTLVTVTKLWLFYKFRSRTSVADPTSDVDVWDMDVVSNTDGSAVLAVYNHAKASLVTIPKARVPVARWFQLESCLTASPGAEGRLRVWLEGEEIFETSGSGVMPSSWVEWNVGSIAQGTQPTSATVYADDAAISTRPLGPDFPVFWRRSGAQ